jgi:hypothetical protein
MAVCQRTTAIWIINLRKRALSRIYIKEVNYAYNRPWRPLGLWAVEATTVSKQPTHTAVNSLVLLAGRALPFRKLVV